MWGSNSKSYITEAYRILESGGKLYIIEATKRWTDICEGGEPADKLIKLLEENCFRIINSSIEKFCMFECIKL
jgi:ubiquinone/menaquinone biosynthesis C-methylase UbiE